MYSIDKMQNTQHWNLQKRSLRGRYHQPSITFFLNKKRHTYAPISLVGMRGSYHTLKLRTQHLSLFMLEAGWMCNIKSSWVKKKHIKRKENAFSMLCSTMISKHRHNKSQTQTYNNNNNDKKQESDVCQKKNKNNHHENFQIR